MNTILLVDDEEPNRALIRAYLAEQALELVDARSGAEALELAERLEPDLALVDVLMPGMDGFEATRRLKALSRDVFSPVVLVTALTDQISRRKGLEAGADDFLSKPVDPQELTVRVRNLLSLREKQRALLQTNAELARLHRFKEDISAMLVHDLKSPLAGSLACVEHALDTCRCGGDTRESLEDARRANLRLRTLIATLLDVDHLEAEKVVPAPSKVDLHPLVADVVQTRRWEASESGITVENRVRPGRWLDCDSQLVSRVVENLIDNALRHTPSGGRIVLEAKGGPGFVQLRIGNTGHPIPPAIRGKLFEKYAQLEPASHRMSHGIGLYFCRLAVAAHGGQIFIEETPDLATVFVIELPKASRRPSNPKQRVPSIPSLLPGMG